jgi:hypothetical protein
LHDGTPFQRVALEFDYEQTTDPVLKDYIGPANGGCRLTLEFSKWFVEELLRMFPK